jgi:hypothetical protein
MEKIKTTKYFFKKWHIISLRKPVFRVAFALRNVRRAQYRKMTTAAQWKSMPENATIAAHVPKYVRQARLIGYLYNKTVAYKVK